MGFGIRAAAVAGVVAATTGVLAGTANASPAQSSGAVFVQTNGLSGNAVVVYDGALHQEGTYATGGRGGSESGAVVDPLASQGSLTLDRAHKLLYAVNAGSNTVTVFDVHGFRLTRLQVISSGGVFPVSVTVRGDLVYVVNARDGGSIQGFRRDGSQLVLMPAWHRALGLNPKASPEFTNSPGQVAFTPDGRHLLVTTKGNTNEVLSYAVGPDGAPSQRPLRNSQPGGAPFALAFDGHRQVVVAQAGPNAAATFGLRGGQLTARSVVATGGKATCWVVGVNGTFYVSNAGSNSITAFRVGANGSLRKVQTVQTSTGSIDLATSSDGRVLYGQTGGGTDTVRAYHINRDGTLSAGVSTAIPGDGNSEGLATA